MGLFMNQQDKRSELQERIAADLRAKAQGNSKVEDSDWDAAKDAAYLEGTREASSHAWAWGLIVLVALGVIIGFLIQGR